MGNIYKDYSGSAGNGPGSEEVENATFQERIVSTDFDSMAKRIQELSKEIEEVRQENDKVSKKNRLLHLKVELLLDMLAQKSAEADILQKDIDGMKKILIKVHPPAQRN